jgi:hypothetical protein
MRRYRPFCGYELRRGVLRVALVRLATVVALLSTAAPAIAQDGDEATTKNYETKLDAVRPAVKGLVVKTEGGDRYLLVTNETGKTVSVAGYDDEPYLRFLPSGAVEANANSPAKYLNEIRFGTPDTVTIPVSALSEPKPRWQKVADNGSYKWFDHRIHWMEKQPPPVVKDKGKRTKIFEWKVPAKVGSRPVTLAGTLSWVPASSESSGLSGGAIAAIVAGVLALLALTTIVLRRRRSPVAATPSEDKAAKEAW